MKNSLSFKSFHKKAKEGSTLNVVFLGGSLTWGANCTNPNKTSYRALMGEYLQNKYPASHINLHDAAIGGTGSDLGLFRLKRDVLKHKPDLVFIDYTVNDEAFSDTKERAETYESILRILLKKGIAVEMVLLGVRRCYEKDTPLKDSLRRAQHLKLAKHYNVAVGDTYPYIRKLVKSGKVNLDEVYCFEPTHPDDSGYRLFFEAARDGFEQAICDKTTCALPKKPLFTGMFSKPRRHELADHPLPKGWNKDKTYRVALWFDGLPSRWMDSVVSCDINDKANVEPITLEFKGQMLGIFGEADSEGLPFKVSIDGEEIKDSQGNPVWTSSTAKFGFTKGNLFVWKLITDQLDSGKHKLQITPVFPDGCKEGKLKINSICYA